MMVEEKGSAASKMGDLFVAYGFKMRRGRIIKSFFLAGSLVGR